MRLKHFWRDPLLHFALIGASIFALYGLFASADDASRRIVVSAPQIAELSRRFAASTGRAPQAQELQAQIDMYIRDEVLYREGELLGLGLDDPVIRRRIQQKYALLAEGSIPDTVPTDKELLAYMQLRGEVYRSPPKVTFDQVVIGEQGSANDAGQALTTVRRALLRGASPAEVGQPSLLPSHVFDVSMDDVVRDFGSQFASQIAGLPQGEWRGPIYSGVGVHLVRVQSYTPAKLQPLASIREQLARDWNNDRRRKMQEAQMTALLRRYDIVVACDGAAHGAWRCEN